MMDFIENNKGFSTIFLLFTRENFYQETQECQAESLNLYPQEFLLMRLINLNCRKSQEELETCNVGVNRYGKSRQFSDCTVLLLPYSVQK